MLSKPSIHYNMQVFLKTDTFIIDMTSSDQVATRTPIERINVY